MKRWFAVVLAIGICFGLSACFQQTQTPPLVAYPQFSYPAAEEPFSRDSISFALVDGMNANSPAKVKVYKAESVVNEKRDLIAAFELEKASRTVGEATVYTNGNKELTVYPNGVYSFTVSSSDDRVQSPCTLTNTQVGTMAQTFLAKNNLLPKGFVLSDKFGEEGVVYTENGEEKTVVTARGAWFQREIDGIPVVGTAKILVQYNSDGLCSVFSVYSELGETTEVELIDIDTAIRRAKTADALLQWDENALTTATSASVTELELVYYDDPLDEHFTHIQPCYRFRGIATDGKMMGGFTILVPALPDEVYKLS